MPFNWAELVRNNPEPDSGGWEPFRYYLPPGAVAGPPRPGTPHPLDTTEMQNLANGALQMMQSDPITAAQSAPNAPSSPSTGFPIIPQSISAMFGPNGFERFGEEVGSLAQMPANIWRNRPGVDRAITALATPPSGTTRDLRTVTPPSQTTPPNPAHLAGMPPIAELASQANSPSPQDWGEATGGQRSGWWAGRPEFNPGPSVLDIFNGSTGTGYDANMYATTPSGGRPTFPSMNNSQLSDLTVSNPSGTPLGTFTAGPVNFRDYHLNSREGDRTRTPEMVAADAAVQRARETAPFAVGSPQWNQAIQAAQSSAYGGLPQAEQQGRRLELDRAVQMGYTPPGGTPVPGAIQNAATTAATAAAATPSAAQSSYVRQRTEILDDARREGLTPEQALARARFYGYGPVLPGGPELNGAPPPVTLNDMLSSAANALRPLDPRTGVPIQGRIDTFGSGNQQRFYDTITNLMQSIPDQEMTPAAVERVRQSVTPIAFQSWLDANPGWSAFGLSAANALHRAQRDRVRNLLSRPQIINNGLPR